jgi:hypothetical protein
MGWWRNLLSSTLPPLAAGSPFLERVMYARAAVACMVLSLAVVLLALVIGLRGVPAELFTPPIVAAAVLMARALVALGLLAVSAALVIAAERLFRASGSGGNHSGRGRPDDPSGLN